MALSNTDPQASTNAAPESARQKQPWGEGDPPWENPNHNGQSQDRHDWWKEMIKLHGLEKTIRRYHLIEAQMDQIGL